MQGFPFLFALCLFFVAVVAIDQCADLTDRCTSVACEAACFDCPSICSRLQISTAANITFQCPPDGTPFTSADFCGTAEATNATYNRNLTQMCANSIDDCDRKACYLVCGNCTTSCLILESYPPQYVCNRPSVVAAAFDVCSNWVGPGILAFPIPVGSPVAASPPLLSFYGSTVLVFSALLAAFV